MNIFIHKSGSGLLPAMLLAVLVLAVSTPLYADRTASPSRAVEGKSQLPDYYPDTFQRTGVVTGSASNRSVIISGTRYYYDNNTRIHILSSPSGYIHNLSKGTEVGFSYTEDDKRRRFLIEAWTLPKGTVKGD